MFSNPTSVVSQVFHHGVIERATPCRCVKGSVDIGVMTSLILSVCHTHTHSRSIVFPSLPGARRAQMPTLKPVAAHWCVCSRSCFPAVQMSHMTPHPMPDGTHKPCSTLHASVVPQRARDACASHVLPGDDGLACNALARLVPSPRTRHSLCCSHVHTRTLISTIGCVHRPPARRTLRIKAVKVRARPQPRPSPIGPPRAPSAENRRLDPQKYI